MIFYERFFAQHKTFVLKIAIFFIYLLIIYPACPARGKKSDDPTCTGHRFFFLYSFVWRRSPQPFAVRARKAVRTSPEKYSVPSAHTGPLPPSSNARATPASMLSAASAVQP